MSSGIPFRQLIRPKPEITVQQNDDGTSRIKSRIELGNIETNIGAYWRRAASAYPERAFLVKCGPDEIWPELTYRNARIQVDQISSFLLRRGYGPDKPVMILSGNSFAHALLTMGAIQVGVPVIPVSPSYSLSGSDFSRLKYALDLTEPALIFAENGDIYSDALALAAGKSVEIVTVTGESHGGQRFDALLESVDAPLVEAAFAAVTSDTLAKILFTSGSTGLPKAVPNTQRMLCAAQKTLELISEERNVETDPVRVLDWLPWHHTYGGNVNFFGIVRGAGTLYMDDGKPAPGLFHRTLANLKRVSPTRFSSVPTAYSFLADELEQDEELAVAFFKNLSICQYGGAAMSQEIFERMQVLAIKYTGLRIPFGTGWGATETTGTGAAVYWETEKVGMIGVPTPGIEIKVIPVGDKLEIRMKGPNVHTGYYKRPDLTATHFDDEGYYCIGDAVKWEDPSRREAGMIFDGRVAEDFKLANGTWVNTGSLRLALIDALDPIARDVVIAGHDRDELGILIVLSETTLNNLMSDSAAVSEDGKIIVASDLMKAVHQKLVRYNQENPAPSRYIAAALILAEPLSAEKNEITDKQYINQGAVLANRADIADCLFARNGNRDVLVLIKANA